MIMKINKNKLRKIASIILDINESNITDIDIYDTGSYYVSFKNKEDNVLKIKVELLNE